MQAVIDAYERNTALILAAEDWPKGYSKTPEQYGKMLRQEAKLQRLILEHFKNLASQVDRFISWSSYMHRLSLVQAAEITVDVLVEDALDQLDDAAFMSAIYDPIAAGVTLGAQSAEELYRINLGVTESTKFVQQAAKQQVAGLVGKTVDKEGIIRPNPNAKYRISNRTKEEIRESINTSLSLHEDIATARARVEKVIKNPKRAEMIAQTEIVNSYNTGIGDFGKASGAIGKEWESVLAKDICAEFAKAGIVDIDHKYTLPSGRKISGPSAHPFCRCFLRLVYQEELEG
jgi:hypothetical protein